MGNKPHVFVSEASVNYDRNAGREEDWVAEQVKSKGFKGLRRGVLHREGKRGRR